MLNYSEEQIDEIICLGKDRVLQLLHKRAVQSSFSTKSISFNDLSKMHLVKLLTKFRHLHQKKSYQKLVYALTKII